MGTNQDFVCAHIYIFIFFLTSPWAPLDWNLAFGRWMKGTILTAFDFSFLKYHSTMYGGSFEHNTLIFCYCFYLHVYISITENSPFTLTIFAFGVILIAINWIFLGEKLFIFTSHTSPQLYIHVRQRLNRKICALRSTWHPKMKAKMEDFKSKAIMCN